jgi:hypothetical protein
LSALWHLALVILLAALAVAATLWLVRRLGRRPCPALRDRLAALLAGLVLVEVAAAPALVAALFPQFLFGAAGSAVADWVAVLVYGGLLVFVFVRLFPWREIAALAEDPEVSLKEVLKRTRDGE